MAFNEIWWKIALLLLGSYLFGNINFALLISKFKKQDIRGKGSGNPGTMNMLRNFGVKLGALTLALDVLKGLLPTMAGWLLFKGKYTLGGFEWGMLMQYAAGFAAVLGHIFPMYLRFKGGKGVATTIGIFMYVRPLVAVAAFVLMLLYIYRFEFGSVGSLLFVTFMCIFEMSLIKTAFGVYPEVTALYCILFMLGFMSYFAHRSNIKRLIMGMENRTPLRQIIATYRRRVEKKRKKKVYKLGKKMTKIERKLQELRGGEYEENAAEKDLESDPHSSLEVIDSESGAIDFESEVIDSETESAHAETDNKENDIE